MSKNKTHLEKSLLKLPEDKEIDRKMILDKNAMDEAILSSIGDGLVVGDKKGKIIYVNQAFEKMVGWKLKEIIGKYIVEVIPRESEEGEEVLFNERILTKILSGKFVVADLNNPFYYIRKDKTRFVASSIINPVMLNGEIMGVVETFRDITKEKEMDRAKTEFISLASHQLRTPLSAISWYTETLLANDLGTLNEGQEKYLNEIYNGNKRMISLVNALLGVSRMDLGIFTLETEPTKMITLIKTVIRDQEVLIKQKNIVLETEFEKDVPTIQTDPKLITIVIENILLNSIKYMPNNGKISIILKNIPKNKKILISISDDGYGIPEDQQDKIFRKLFRADNVREKNIEGTGLGLYIVKTIVDNSGGKVYFKSKENTGTTFCVELPYSIESKKLSTNI